ncbi:MAG TPA: hypothetical protein VLX85_10025 [Stellaceae bacterium]|nr:hypothetical protein [Stellaceae bacterium]
MVQRVYRSARGPTPADGDVWRLVFEPGTPRLLVRHEWTTTGHDGVDGFEVAEFLAGKGAAQGALIATLFGVNER